MHKKKMETSTLLPLSFQERNGKISVIEDGGADIPPALQNFEEGILK